MFANVGWGEMLVLVVVGLVVLGPERLPGAIRWTATALRQARAASGIITLQTVVGHVKPTILIGASTSHGAFTREVVETMSAGTRTP